jgi:ABC-type transport system involved in multi-copper enzyme maturation permease subunit
MIDAYTIVPRPVRRTPSQAVRWFAVRAIAVREVQDQLRDWRILAPIAILTLVFPSLMTLTAERLLGYVNEFGAGIVAERLTPFLMIVVGFFPVVVSLVIALEAFVGEKERLSLEPLLVTPLTDGELFFGKWLASTFTPISASLIGTLLYVGGVLWRTGWTPPETLLIQTLLLNMVQAMVMVSAAVVISSQVTSVRAANLLAGFVVLPFAMLVQGAIVMTLWGQYNLLWWLMAALVVLLVILVRMGVALFNREALLGRDIDMLDLRAAGQFFWRTWHGPAQPRHAPVSGWLARGWAWYRREVGAALRRTSLPLKVLGLVLAFAYINGYAFAARYPLPAEVAGTLSLADLGARIEQLGLASVDGATWVFSNNVRALGLAAVAGALSLGTAAVLLLMTPMALAGFLTAQLAALGFDPLTVFVAFFLPHALVEVPAALIAGGATLRLGTCLMAPDRARSLGETWLEAFSDWAKLFLGLVVPLLAVGALTEAFITPTFALWILGH